MRLIKLDTVLETINETKDYLCNNPNEILEKAFVETMLNVMEENIRLEWENQLIEYFEEQEV